MSRSSWYTHWRWVAFGRLRSQLASRQFRGRHSPLIVTERLDVAGEVINVSWCLLSWVVIGRCCDRAASRGAEHPQARGSRCHLSKEVKLEQRSIGGFKVSVLGLGTSRLASLGAGGSLRQAGRLLDAAADLGVSFIDTADTYGSTQAERWLGELMQKHGHRFVVATKCGLPTVDLPRPLRPFNQPSKESDPAGWP